MPAVSDEILLSPADVHTTTAADSLGLPTEPGFDRGFEPITSAVSINPHTEALVSELAADAQPTPAHKEVVAEVAPGERDPLVEAAVAMVRAATEKELAAEAAASPGSAATPTVDPATLEHVIRGVVGKLMPQIVAQVKSALKH
ncbi:MAG: hypothetical protein EXQ56_10435 [Acidobacteria bacterium]|nr:hypothetical protein [Acidobacteriota bacterium]